jgi:hypothetical protein
MCIVVDCIRRKVKRLAAQFAGMIPAVLPRGWFLCSFCSLAFQRLAKHSVPGDLKSPIGDLEFDTHNNVTSFV